jgi:NAD-dependent dihydropyrimidine dehydrogenase PreA subunit
MNLYYIIGAVIAVWFVGNVFRRGKRKNVFRYGKRKNKVIYVVSENCTGCKQCIKICHRNVLEAVKDTNGTHIVVKNPDNCTACGNCMQKCKFNALFLDKRTESKK